MRLLPTPRWILPTRLGWLELNQHGYAPQLYEQLASAYRRAGNVRAARQVGIARRRRRHRELSKPGKAWSDLLYWTVGYGYEPGWAAVWLAALVTAGSLVFRYSCPVHIHRASAGVPRFNPFVYALDTVLPIVNLG